MKARTIVTIIFSLAAIGLFFWYQGKSLFTPASYLNSGDPALLFDWITMAIIAFLLLFPLVFSIIAFIRFNQQKPTRAFQIIVLIATGAILFVTGLQFGFLANQISSKSDSQSDVLGMVITVLYFIPFVIIQVVNLVLTVLSIPRLRKDK